LKQIYIGKDSIGSYRYMGSPDMDVVNADFAALSGETRRSYSVHKEILWESETATEAGLCAKKVEFIRRYRSNDPDVGHNRRPRRWDGHVDEQRADPLQPASEACNAFPVGAHGLAAPSSIIGPPRRTCARSGVLGRDGLPVAGPHS